MHPLLRQHRLGFITSSRSAYPAMDDGSTLAAMVDHAQLQTQVEQFRHQHRLPGLGVVLVQNDTILSACSGQRRIDSPERIQITDPYPLSALNHALTATLIERWVEQGRLSWDATLADLLPAWRAQMCAEYQTVSLRQLLQHRAGLPRDLSGMNYPDLLARLGGNDNADRATAVRWVLQQASVSTTKQPHHSNIGYMIAVIIIELIEGNTYENIVHQHVLRPLNIHAQAIQRTPLHGHHCGSRNWLSRFRWQIVKPCSEVQHRLAKLDAASGISLSLADYGIILREHLLRLRRQLALRNQASVQQRHTATDHDALGWSIIHTAQFGSINVRDGAVNGGVNYALLAPSKNRAVAVMCNGESTRTRALMKKLAQSWLT